MAKNPNSRTDAELEASADAEAAQEVARSIEAEVAQAAADEAATQAPAQEVELFDPYAPCPVCKDFYPHVAPDGADVSRGIAYPALLHHYAKNHPDAVPPKRKG